MTNLSITSISLPPVECHVGRNIALTGHLQALERQPTQPMQSFPMPSSQSMHETQEEQEETQVLQVCLGLGRFGHAFATKELDPYLGDKISNYSIKNSQGRAGQTSNQSINKQCAVCAEVDPYLREPVFWRN